MNILMDFCRINIKEKQIEEYKYEVRGMEERNKRHKERVSNFSMTKMFCEILQMNTSDSSEVQGYHTCVY